MKLLRAQNASFNPSSEFRLQLPFEIIVLVQNRAIEIHDSALDQITVEAGEAVQHFRWVYIHSSEGRPAIDEGSGWTQEAVIRIGNAQIEDKFSQEGREAYGGLWPLP